MFIPSVNCSATFALLAHRLKATFLDIGAQAIIVAEIDGLVHPGIVLADRILSIYCLEGQHFSIFERGVNAEECMGGLNYLPRGK